MTDKQKIKELEERIRMLETRPEQHIHYHMHPVQPSPAIYPTWPTITPYPQPWWHNPITCGVAAPQIGTISYSYTGGAQ